MEERCDHYPNCDDHSDEEDCHVVLPPYDYHAFYAPFSYTSDGHKLVKVPVKIKVLSIFLSDMFDSMSFHFFIILQISCIVLVPFASLFLSLLYFIDCNYIYPVL